MKRTITSYFSDDKKYFENSLGSEFNFTAATGPYEYLLGALSGCFMFTLLSYEKTSSWDFATIRVEGEKREESPTTLKETSLFLKVRGAEDKEEFLSLVEKAKNECSIYKTIECVSKMNVTVEFV